MMENKPDEAKKYMTKEFINVMEKARMLDQWLADVGNVDPKAVEAAVKGTSVRLTFEKIEPERTFYVVVDMVRDDGQWKVGGPL